jgi:hypothetical protein
MAVVLPIVEEQAAAPRLVLLINFIDELQRRTAK